MLFWRTFLENLMTYKYSTGLTKREWFVGQIINGLCVGHLERLKSSDQHLDPLSVVTDAVFLADKLIAELEKVDG